MIDCKWFLIAIADINDAVQAATRIGGDGQRSFGRAPHNASYHWRRYLQKQHNRQQQHHLCLTHIETRATLQLA